MVWSLGQEKEIPALEPREACSVLEILPGPSPSSPPPSHLLRTLISELQSCFISSSSFY